MKLTNLVALIFLMSACAGGKNEAKRTTNISIADLVEQKAFYLSEMPQGPAGFIEHDKCDSLLFSGMALAFGLDVDIVAARDSSGKWFRTPDHKCYDEGRSRSDISRDMLVGLEWGLYGRQMIDVAKALYEYGDKKKWVMGRGNMDTVYFLPQFQNTLRVLIGKDDSLPEVWADPIKDHQRHIVALNIILRGELEGNIRDDQLQLIKSFRKKEPRNALFQYGYHRFKDGDQTETVELLRNAKFFPTGRLPNNTDRCHRWLWEKSDGEEWQPCQQKRIHTGGDFVFIVWLLERSVN